jgi:hypothetical protein
MMLGTESEMRYALFYTFTTAGRTVQEECIALSSSPGKYLMK